MVNDPGEADLRDRVEPSLQLRTQQLLWREVDDEIVVLDLSKSEYVSVNAAGRTLWLRLARGATRSELADELRQTYGLEPDVARRDADAFVAHLQRQGLLA